jgi:hypothetical protein
VQHRVDPSYYASTDGRRDVFIYPPIGKGCVCTCEHHIDDDPHDGIVPWPEGQVERLANHRETWRCPAADLNACRLPHASWQSESLNEPLTRASEV